MFQTLAAAAAMVATMEALVLNRSSLVMPGLRGIPAGITTISAPTKLASNKPSDGGLGLNVGQVSGHPGGVHDVVQVELGHGGVQLQQHGQGPANAWIRKIIKCIVYIFIRLGIAEGLSDAIPDDLQKIRCAKSADQVAH